MNKLRNNQHGTAHLLAALAIIVVATVAFAGYRVMHASKSAPATTASSSRSLTVAATNPPASIKSKADINRALQALNSDQISSQLNPGQLNVDLNSLL